MKIAMWSSFLIDNSPYEMLSFFRKAGFEYTEFSDEHAKMLLEEGKPEDAGRELLKCAESEGISFPQGHLLLSADICHPDATERRRIVDTLKKWCDLFNAMEITAGVLHTGGRVAEEQGIGTEVLDEMRTEALRELCGHVEGSPLVICLENVYSLPGAKDIDGILDIIEKADSHPNLGICLDTGHLNITGGNQGNFIRKAGERLKALHIADNLGQNDDHILPYGNGTVDWEDVMSALKEIGYNHVFNFEVPGERKCPPEVRMIKLKYAFELAKIMVG